MSGSMIIAACTTLSLSLIKICLVLIPFSSSAFAGEGRLDRSYFQMTFEENFDGPLSWCSQICTGETWRTKYLHSGETPLSRGLGMNGSESQVYMDPKYLGLQLSPFELQDGKLSIKARPADRTTRNRVRDSWPDSYDGERLEPQFTSGLLTTEGIFYQLYGYFEARIKIPDGAGAWPAFWLIGAPGLSDEIDIMEVLCGEPTTLYGGHQWGPWGNKSSERFERGTTDLSRDFHVYGALWTAEEITYYVDDREIGKFPNPGLHQPLFLLINLAMDGDWNKQMGFRAADDLEASMTIDYIRAYKLSR
jgi:beta-glucanase (GH16 family)